MDACCRHKTVPGTERHECVLGSLYWVGYMPWTIYFGFKKDLRAFVLKFGVVLFKWEREGTLVLCCYHNKPPHVKAAQRTQIYLPLLKFCRSSRACQHRSEVWRVSRQADIKVSAGLGSLLEGLAPSGCWWSILSCSCGPEISILLLALWGPLPASRAHHLPTFLGPSPPPSIFKPSSSRPPPCRVASFWLFLGHPISLLWPKPVKVLCLWNLVWLDWIRLDNPG